MKSSNSPRPVAVVVLAAGKGTRLPGPVPKALVECLGEPLLAHVRRAVVPLAATETVVVVGHAKEVVGAWLAGHWPEARAVVQEPQHGTGHAARVALDAIPDFLGDVVLVCADVPQLAADDLTALLAAHRHACAAATVLVGEAADAGRLGRIVRDAQGRVTQIVEARDATPAQLALTEFNTGIYVFDAARLAPALAGLSRANAQGEQYLTDVVAALAASGQEVLGIRTENAASLLGVNTPSDLAAAVAALRLRTVGAHLAAGVQIVDPASTVIEEGVRIAPGARILPFTYVAHGCVIGAGCIVGPFAHLRGGTVLEEGAQVGNFVEVKGSRLGRGAKAKHLSYLGDADVGAGANIGCGTITANYDGKKKHRTTVGPGAHLGSGTVLVAPVTVGAGARTGAGAVVTAGRHVADGETVVGVPARSLVASPKPAAKAVAKAAPPRVASSSAPSPGARKIARATAQARVRSPKSSRKQSSRKQSSRRHTRKSKP